LEARLLFSLHLSEAKDLLFLGAGKQQVLRFVQDDNLSLSR